MFISIAIYHKYGRIAFIKQTVLIVHFGINIKLLTFINGIKVFIFSIHEKVKKNEDEKQTFQKIFGLVARMS